MLSTYVRPAHSTFSGRMLLHEALNNDCALCLTCLGSGRRGWRGPPPSARRSRSHPRAPAPPRSAPRPPWLRPERRSPGLAGAAGLKYGPGRAAHPKNRKVIIVIRIRINSNSNSDRSNSGENVHQCALAQCQGSPDDTPLHICCAHVAHDTEAMKSIHYQQYIAKFTKLRKIRCACSAIGFFFGFLFKKKKKKLSSRYLIPTRVQLATRECCLSRVAWRPRLQVDHKHDLGRDFRGLHGVRKQRGVGHRVGAHRVGAGGSI